MNIHHMT